MGLTGDGSMDLKYLNYIVKTAEYGSITRAAQNLFISQPYLSRIIKEVEEEFRLIIFIRTRQGIILTPQGEKFINNAEKIIRDYKKFFKIGNNRTSDKNKFSVTTIRSSLVMEAFIKLAREYKEENELVFNIRETESDIPIQDVQFLNSDLGIIYSPINAQENLIKELNRKDIGYRKICRFDPCIVVGTNHPLVKFKDHIKIEDLYSYGFVKYGKNYMPYDNESLAFNYYDNLIDQSKIKRHITVSDRASLHNILTNTDFFSLGTKAAKDQESIFNIASIPIETNFKKEYLEMWVIYQNSMGLTPIADRFIEILIENYGDREK